MPPKIHLFISFLCHAAVVALWCFGPPLPTIELAGIQGQTPSQKQTAQVRLKREADASADSRGKQTTKQPDSVSIPKLDGQVASAESQQHTLPTGDGLSVDRPEPSASSQSEPKAGPNGHSQEQVTVSREPPAPIRYTGAPQPTKAGDRPQFMAQQEESGQHKLSGTASAASLGGIPERQATTDVLPAADGLHRDDGLQAPAFNVYLPPDDIDLILLARQGVLLVLCEQEQYLVEGTLHDPTRVFPATSQLLQTFSERALQVPSGYCQRISERLQGNFAITEDRIKRCRFHLLLSNQVDYLVLNRQRAAASRLRCSLEELVATFGRFEFANRQVADYQIQSVALKDGRRLPLASVSALPGHPETR